MKVIYFGASSFDSPILESLKENFELDLLVRSSDVKNPSEILGLLNGTAAQVGVVANFGYIIPKGVLEFFPKGIINIHPSLLPKYRGPSPVQTAILNGDKTTGVTIIKIDDKVDHGPILEQKEIEILAGETSQDLLKRLFEIGAKMLPQVLSNYIKGEIKLSVQDDLKATFTEILTKETGFISLENIPEKEKLSRMVRAFHPWPGVWFRTEINEKKTLVKLLPEERIQVEGKNPMSYKDFVNGYKEGAGIISALGF